MPVFQKMTNDRDAEDILAAFASTAQQIEAPVLQVGWERKRARAAEPGLKGVGGPERGAGGRVPRGSRRLRALRGHGLRSWHVSKREQRA